MSRLSVVMIGCARARRLALWALLCGVTAGGFANASGGPQSQPARAPTTVLFLCPHGAAKSVLASAYFQRAAKERGLNVRVEAAGTDPDPAVSRTVADHLRTNGYEVPVTKPRKVTRKDLEAADVVISLGCDLTGQPVRAGTLQKWDEVPGPGQDMKAADEAIRRRVMALVEELLAQHAGSCLRDHWFEIPPDGIGDTTGTSRVGMNAVRSIQIRVQGDALEDERYEWDLISHGQPFEDTRKINGVLPAVPRRHHHAAQQDGGVLSLRALDDGRQVFSTSAISIPRSPSLAPSSMIRIRASGVSAALKRRTP